MKSLSKILLALYLLTLVWLILFKLSFDLPAVLGDQTRSLNLVPFADPLQNSFGNHLREVIFNLIVFIPFGLLLSINIKRTSFWRKLAFILGFSITAEIIQFVLAIGRTDITDVITNAFGGFLGLILYDLSNKYVHNEKLERVIVLAGITLLLSLILVRTLLLKVRY